MVISKEDFDQLRGAPAFRRAVLGMRLLFSAPIFVLVSAVLLIVGLPSYAGTSLFYFAFAMMVAGLGTIFSSMMPLEKVKKDVLFRYQLSAFDRSVLMNKMLLRAVLGKDDNARDQVDESGN
jgi:hypothetical protein